MAFTRALYYPTIDITNEDWLKTAVLFWDEINTIVPESINNPFKRKYSDELGLFRTNIAKLTQQVSTDKSIEAVKQQVQDIYINEFSPAFNNFKKALSGLGIKWSADNFMKVAFFSTGTAAIPTALLGLSIPTAIMAGAGISLVSLAISYNIDKQRQLRENPFTPMPKHATHTELKSRKIFGNTILCCFNACEFTPTTRLQSAKWESDTKTQKK